MRRIISGSGGDLSAVGFYNQKRFACNMLIEPSDNPVPDLIMSFLMLMPA
jgi:hypothetical protein